MPFVGYDASSLLYNDLYSSTVRTLSLPGNVKTRAQCTTSNPTMPDTYCLPRDYDFALAITGVVDPRRELLPISLSVGRCVCVWGGGYEV